MPKAAVKKSNTSSIDDKYIFQYLHDGLGRKRGIIVAISESNNAYRIGVSLFNLNKERLERNKFSRERGLEIAIRRAKKKKGFYKLLKYQGQVLDFVERSNKYFKNRFLSQKMIHDGDLTIYNNREETELGIKQRLSNQREKEEKRESEKAS